MWRGCFRTIRRSEEAYFRRPRFFRSCTLIGIRRSLVEKHPWLAVSVYKAFIKAKALCMKEFEQIGHLATSLPWSVYEYERLKRVLGEDYWSYGARSQPPRAGNAGALFVRSGPVGAEIAAGGNVRALDV